MSKPSLSPAALAQRRAAAKAKAAKWPRRAVATIGVPRATRDAAAARARANGEPLTALADRAILRELGQ